MGSSVLFGSITKLQPFLTTTNFLESFVRYGHQRCTKNTCHSPRPKFRGVRVVTGHTIKAGSPIVTQFRLRFLPGSNVTFGKRGTLVAQVDGTVHCSCEVWNPDWTHTWVQRFYGGREGQKIYKKYFNVVPEPMHNRFKLIDTV